MDRGIVVIGGGPGGYVAAIRAAQLGAQVIVIEADNVGGTCLNWGCIPSKVMKETAGMLQRFRRGKEFGITVDGDFTLNIKALMGRKKAVIDNQAKGILKIMKHHKIKYIKGFASIKCPNIAVVTPPDGKSFDVPWGTLILAPGSQPLNIPSFPFDGETILSSNDILNLQGIPESILVVGAGVIGCEFAFILEAFGSKVTVVEAMARILPLPSVDEDCSKTLQREMKKHKIEFMVNRTVQRVEQERRKLFATIGHSPFVAELKNNVLEPIKIEVDKILVCVGRKSSALGIGLDNIGVTVDDKGWIQANERMETNVPDVYAVGDVLGPSKIMLAHVASAEGLVAAENAMGGDLTMNYDVVPGVVFSMPEVANVGLTELKARERGYHVRSDTVLFRNVGKAQVSGDIAGQAKIISNAENGKILGVHLVGPNASELIAEGTLAIQAELTIRELAETIHAHPTLAEIFQETSFKSLGRSLHG